MKAYETIIQSIKDTAEQATGEGIDVSEAIEAVERSTKKHTEVLTNLLDEVPEQARAAIAHAIEVSKRGRTTALDRLEKIKRGEVPSGRPEGVEKSEKSGKPEGVGKSKETDRPSGKGRP